MVFIICMICMICMIYRICMICMTCMTCMICMTHGSLANTCLSCVGSVSCCTPLALRIKMTNIVSTLYIHSSKSCSIRRLKDTHYQAHTYQQLLGSDVNECQYHVGFFFSFLHPGPRSQVYSSSEHIREFRAQETFWEGKSTDCMAEVL